MERSNGAGELHLPPGFRFFPTDDELVNYYLLPKCAGRPISVPIIAELDLYKFDPWQLPGMAWYGEKEWYFFSPRDRKYPNGSRPNRAAGNGYWKATGADKPIGSPRSVAIKKSLVFYSGKAPSGEKTNWIMHEYRLAGVDRSARKKNCTLRLDEWVLCRIYNKKGAIGKQTNPDRKLAGLKKPNPVFKSPETKPEHITPPPLLPWNATRPKEEVIYFGSPESDGYIHFDPPKPRLGGGAAAGETSTSDHKHVLSSEESTGDLEDESQRRWWNEQDWDWEKALEFADSGEPKNGSSSGFVPISSVFRNSFEDALMFLQESF